MTAKGTPLLSNSLLTSLLSRPMKRDRNSLPLTGRTLAEADLSVGVYEQTHEVRRRRCFSFQRKGLSQCLPELGASAIDYASFTPLLCFDLKTTLRCRMHQDPPHNECLGIKKTAHNRNHRRQSSSPISKKPTITDPSSSFSLLHRIPDTHHHRVVRRITCDTRLPIPPALSQHS